MASRPTLKFATRPEDWEAVRHLRHAVYVVETGRLRGVEDTRHTFDAFDQFSKYILAYIGEEPVGTIKIIADSERGLPCEGQVSLNALRAIGRPAEMGHLLTMRTARTRRVALDLMKMALAYACVFLDVTHIVGDFFVSGANDESLAEFYRAARC
jgi:hypothetical protein